MASHIQIINGVPYWISSENTVFLFINSPIPEFEIGKFEPLSKSIILNADWKSTASVALKQYRESIKPVARADYATIPKFSKKSRSSRQNDGKKSSTAAKKKSS